MAEGCERPLVVMTRIDGQITALAGELFVAAELLKRGLQTSVTFGNAKAIYLLAYNPVTKRSFTVQVKSLRTKNVFPISHSKIEPEHIYVFVLLNAPGIPVQYFIVPGRVLSEEPDRFNARWFQDQKFPGIDWQILARQGFEDCWEPFAEVDPSQ